MTEKVTLHAPDISCAHCVATVTQAVGALPGVESVEASETTKNVVVVFNNESVSQQQIAQTLDQAGYPVSSN